MLLITFGLVFSEINMNNIIQADIEARRVRRPIFDVLKSNNVTFTEWEILTLLYGAKEKNSSTLAQETYMDTGTVSRTLSTLENKEALIRKHNKKDRRVVKVEITEVGRCICDAVSNGLMEAGVAIDVHLE